MKLKLTACTLSLSQTQTYRSSLHSSVSRARLLFVIDFSACTSNVITLSKTDQNWIPGWVYMDVSLTSSVAMTSICVSLYVGEKKKKNPKQSRPMQVTCRVQCCIKCFNVSVSGALFALPRTARLRYLCAREPQLRICLWIYSFGDPFPSTPLSFTRSFCLASTLV